MTFASKITLSRLLLVPVFAVLAIAYSRTVATGTPDESLRWWALGVFITCAMSDGIDGWIARHFNQRSKFGAYIDPIADKALLLTGVITLSLVDWGQQGWRLPVWFVVIVMVRDGVILGGINVLYYKRIKVNIIPHWSGKVCTVTQMFALGWVMLKVAPFPPTWPCVVAAVFTAWSAVIYFRQGLRILRQAAAA